MQGNLDAAIMMTQRLEVYHGGDGTKAGGKGFKNSKIKIKKRVTWRRSKGACLGPGGDKTIVEKGQERLGLWW